MFPGRAEQPVSGVVHDYVETSEGFVRASHRSEDGIPIGAAQGERQAVRVEYRQLHGEHGECGNSNRPPQIGAYGSGGPRWRCAPGWPWLGGCRRSVTSPAWCCVAACAFEETEGLVDQNLCRRERHDQVHDHVRVRHKPPPGQDQGQSHHGYYRQGLHHLDRRTRRERAPPPPRHSPRHPAIRDTSMPAGR